MANETLLLTIAIVMTCTLTAVCGYMYGLFVHQSRLKACAVRYRTQQRASPNPNFSYAYPVKDTHT
ncbi:MAG TPA: hypothetical protein V6C81_30290 [Planktothrix sp.]|jgi:hypothetical protein